MKIVSGMDFLFDDERNIYSEFDFSSIFVSDNCSFDKFSIVNLITLPRFFHLPLHI